MKPLFLLAGCLVMATATRADATHPIGSAPSAPGQETPLGEAPLGEAPLGEAPLGEAGIGPATLGSQGPAGGALSEGGGAAGPALVAPDETGAGLADGRLEASAAAPVLGLEEAVGLALRNNPTPRQARAALDAALARVGIATSAGRPQANVGANVNFSRGFGGGGGGTSVPNPDDPDGPPILIGTGGGSSDFNQQLSLGASIPLVTGGRVRANRGAAQAAALAAQANAQSAEQQLASQTILAYLNALQSRELLTVAQSNLETSRERRRVSGVRFDAGVAPRLELLRADADLAAATQRRIAAAASLAQSQATINVLLARDPETPFGLEPVEGLSIPEGLRFPLLDQANALASGQGAPSSSELRALAVEGLPSLEAARQSIEAARLSVEAQRAQRRPSLSLSLSALLRNPAQFAGRFLLGAGVGLAQTLLDGGRIGAQIDEARANLETARLSLDAQELQVAGAIEGALLGLDSALRRLNSTEVAVAAAQEALRAAQLAFTAGIATPLEVVDAQNALVLASTDAVAARYEIAVAQLQLATASSVAGASAGGAARSAGAGFISGFSPGGGTGASAGGAGVGAASAGGGGLSLSF